MKIDILTLFPEMFEPLKTSILGRALDKGLFEINLIILEIFLLISIRKLMIMFLVVEMVCL